MRTRTITAIVGAIIIAPFLVFFDTYAGAALIQIAGVICTYELLNATGLKKKWFLVVPLYILALGLPLLVYFKENENFFRYSAVIFFLLSIYMLTVSVFSKGKIQVDNTSVLFTMSFYVLMGLNCLYLLRTEEQGALLYMLPLVTSWSTDIFAYFSGRLFGRHKLIPDVSPQKTVEGAVGGFVCSVGIIVLYGLLMKIFFEASPNYLNLIIAGTLMSIASMAGDLIASLVKRHYGIKDYGWLLPGHGGALDRIDSVLAAAPLLMILHELPMGFALFR